MSTLVCKFGGTSLADAGQFIKVQKIMQSDPRRKYVVPSAPGKRHAHDRKITDLLYLCHAHVQQEVPFDEVFQLIESRYTQIVRDLNLKLDLSPVLGEIKRRIAAEGVKPGRGTADYAASRGEYVSGLILADLLKFDFVDPAEIIVFDEHGRFDAEATQTRTMQRLGRSDKAVIPGFYGAMGNGQIKTFSRGGSDITGAIIARGVNAKVYENWTDVNGLLMADPRVVENPRPIDVITYRELRELAYMGANVLHDEAIFPVRKAGIPVNIRNTNQPDHPGTLIVAEAETVKYHFAISGIAGRKEFTVIALEKALMNSELGFGRRVLSVLEEHGVSFEHCPSGIDTMSVVVSDKQLEGKLERIIADLRSRCEPDAIDVSPNMALVATVGRGMIHTPGIAAKLFNALGAAGVNIRMIDQGSSEINIIVGVETADFERAMRAIYNAFVK